MEIFSGTDPEPGVLKMSCPYCQQTFETYDKVEKNIGIHIMRLETCTICLNNIKDQT